MRSDVDHPSGALLIFSFGAPMRLQAAVDAAAAFADRIYWVDPLLDEAGPAWLTAQTPVEIISAALVPSGRKANLLAYSLPDLFSLTPATGALTSLLPGLRVMPGQSVKATTPAALMKKLAKVKGPVDVIVDVPGAEAAVLDAMSRAPLEGQVRTVTLRAGVDAFFEGGLAMEDALTKLEDLGFARTALETEDPDWPEAIVSFDAQANQIKALEAECAALKKAQNRYKTQVKSVKADLKAAQSALEAETASARKTIADQQTKAEATLVAEKARLTQALADAQEEAEEVLSAEKAAHAKTQTQTQDELKTLRETIAKMTQGADQQGQALAAAQAQAKQIQQDMAGAVTEKTKRLEDVQKQADETAQALATAQADHDALKQMMAEKTAKIAELSGETSRLQGALEEKTAALADGVQRLEAAEKAAAEAAQQQAEARTQLDKANQDLKAKTDAAAKLDIRVQQQTKATVAARTELRAVQLQTDESLRRADLFAQTQQVNLDRAIAAQERAQAECDAFRTRLTAVEEDRDALRRLLQQLTPRLREASRVMRDLPFDGDVAALVSGSDGAKKKKKKRKSS